MEFNPSVPLKSGFGLFGCLGLRRAVSHCDELVRDAVADEIIPNRFASSSAEFQIVFGSAVTVRVSADLDDGRRGVAQNCNQLIQRGSPSRGQRHFIGIELDPSM